MRNVIFGIIAFYPPGNDNEPADYLTHKKLEEKYQEALNQKVCSHMQRIIASHPQPLTEEGMNSTLKELSEFSQRVAAPPPVTDIIKFKHDLEQRELAELKISDLFWCLPDLPEVDGLK
jgi:hypothetical protein